ncbi:DUF2663 family protein [Texcoconibacillus texcoconensis]|uniref:DUF2663 family protein n=1 Tax=Texcoconibacillus texcoconensis TaxID=1095777 RepID=A0A840QNJ7_9BACI|nr:hypothetical protein [Texcoconibacillus texcoconensis]
MTIVVDELLKCKQKEKEAEKKVYRAGYCFFFVLAISLIYVTFLLLQTGTPNSYLTLILGDQWLLLLLLMMSLSFYQVTMRKSKLDKAEKDFDELREDIIDRLSDIWDTEENWKEKHKLFQELKNDYDINLFYK